MENNESSLLFHALCYEQGHERRTQHILKVYALAKLLGEQEGLDETERQTLQAAAILHDIPIRYCKEHYNGDACQENQQREAPHLVNSFLLQAGYCPGSIPAILELVLRHHDYKSPRSRLLQLLIEADLIVNCYETRPNLEQQQNIQALFETDCGKQLLELCLHPKPIVQTMEESAHEKA